MYLAGCTVGGRSVAGYTYGKEEAAPTYTAYSIGDEVTYNNVDYRVIKDSSTSESSVTLLKSEPLTYEEVQTYSNGTGESIYDNNGIGGMRYHSSSNNYETSYIKTTVDAWKASKAPAASEARLITKEELVNNLGYVLDTEATSEAYVKSEDTPNWVYNSNYSYWTMSPWNDSNSGVVFVYYDSGLIDNGAYGVDYGNDAVRPVIVLSKSEL